LDAFDTAWRTIRDNYFDPTFNNLDWTQIRLEFEPRVRAAKTDAELHTLLSEMLKRLGRSHLAIIPPQVYQEIEKARATAKERERARRERTETTQDESGVEDGDEEPLDLDDPLTQYGTGIHLRLIGSKFIVSKIDKNSSAEYAGMKLGYAVETINEVSLPILLAKVRAYSPTPSTMNRYLPIEIVHFFLNGEKDSLVHLTYLDEKNQPKEISLPRERLRSTTVSVAANFPDAQLSFETQSLNDDVGLVQFNVFAMPVIEKFCDALTEFKGKKALILDLRGNLGGSMAVVIGLTGMLAERDVDLGKAIYRSGAEPLRGQAKAKHFTGRIVVLVDGMTASAAEMLAASLQDSHRALIVGDKTAGETLPAVAVDLPTGARMLYPIANYQSAAGTFLEVNGVVPDYPVALDQASLLQGRDAQIERALALVKDDSAFAKLSKSVASAPPIEMRAPVNTGSAPPPPPPARKAPDQKVLAEVTIKAPAPPPPPLAATTPEPGSQDPRAMKIIDEFTRLAGSADGLAESKTYSMIGKMELTTKGIRQEFDYAVYGEKGGKYVEINRNPGTGEIRSIYDGKETHIKTDFGIDRKLPIRPSFDLAYLSPVSRLRYLTKTQKVSYLGIFDRGARKVHVIEISDRSNVTIAITFDVESKMLTSIAGPGVTLSYDDFRKVGNFMLPFRVENGSFLTIRLDELKLNEPIDPAIFQHKDYCFDKP
jgi:carboxyl-terminal processing protease